MHISISTAIGSRKPAAETIVPAGHVGLVLVYGQSLALGTNSSPLLSAATLINAQMLHFPRPAIDSKLTADNKNTPFDPDTITTTPALVESISANESNDYAETPLSGVATALEGLSTQDVIYIAAGLGATTVADLGPGSWHFANVFAMVDMLKEISGLPVYHLATHWIHGEADAAAGTTYANYKDPVIQTLRDINRMIQYKTGIDSSPKTVMTQCGAFALGANLVAIQNAQHDAALEGGFYIRQMYDKGYVAGDGAHLSAQGSRDTGADIGDAQVNETSDIIVKSATISGSTITIDVDETGLTTDSSILNTGGNNGIRIDSGTISNVTVNDSDITVTFTGGPPTWVSIAQDLTLLVNENPDQSQTDIWDGTRRLLGGRFTFPYTAPEFSAESTSNGSHTPTAAEQAIIDKASFGTWKKFDADLMSGTTLYCYGKSGNNCTSVGTVPAASATQINGHNVMDFGGALHFLSDRAEMGVGSYTVVLIGILDEANNNQMLCAHNGTDRRYYLTSNTNLQWGTGTHNSNTLAQGTGTPFIYIASYNYDTEVISQRLNGGTTDTTAGHATYTNTPNNFTELVYGGLMNSGTVINLTTDTIADIMIFHDDLITLNDYSDIETYANTQYGITIT